MNDDFPNDPSQVTWQHMDYYVRRDGDQLFLVQTLLKESADQSEICTFYIDLDQLEADWVEAIFEQGADLEDGKSCDFVPPDEIAMYGLDEDDD